MIMKAFSVYDSKALCYGVPFFMNQVGQAVRAFADLSNDPQTTIYKHPTDYVLYQVGEFDDSVGMYKNLDVHLMLGHGADFKEKVGAGMPGLLNAPLLTESNNGKE